MDDERLRARIGESPYWYHKIPLREGIVTPGWAPIYAPSYRIAEDLTGKRVLDIGAWDGYWTFEALRRGAASVVAIDDFSDHINDARPVRKRSWANFDLCREILGYSEEVCQRHEYSVYDLKPENFGRFDVVFFFGVLYHLKYPMYALDRIAEVCDDTLHVESAILDDFSAYRGHGKHFEGAIVMEFYPGSEFSNNSTGWWSPTLACLGHMCRAAGFEEVSGWKLTDDVQNQAALCRGFIQARKSSSAS